MGLVSLNFIPKSDVTGSINDLSDSIMFDTGSRIGIGTTAPDETLGILGSLSLTGPTPSIRIDATGGSTVIDVKQTGDAEARTAITMVTDGFRFQTGDGVTVPTTKVTFLGNGRVGIGTTAPASELEVVGAIKQSGAVPVFRVDVDTGTYTFGVRTTGDAEARTNVFFLNDGFRFQTGDGTIVPTSKMTILANGSVGIGTTGPTVLLDVAGAITSSTTITASALVASTITSSGTIDATGNVVAADVIATG